MIPSLPNPRNNKPRGLAGDVSAQSRKILAIFVALLMVAGSYLGINYLGSTNAEPPTSGDWTITTNESYSDQTIVIKGNVTIKEGGHLSLSNVTLRIDQNSAGQYRIDIQKGGNLTIINSGILSNNSYKYIFNITGYFRADDSIISDLWGNATNGGLIMDMGMALFSNINLNNTNTIGVTARNGTLAVFYDINFTNIGSYDMKFVGNSTISLIDPIYYNESGILFSDSLSRLFINWTIVVAAVDAMGYEISGANITIKDNYQNIVLNSTTTGKSQLRSSLMRYLRNSSGYLYLTPYNVTASKGNWISYLDPELNMTSVTRISIELIGPEIRLTNETISNYTAEIGSTIYFNATVENSGNESANNVSVKIEQGLSRFTDSEHLDDSLVDNWTVLETYNFNFSAISYENISKSWNVTGEGMHYVRFTVDYNNNVTELLEDNNQLSISFYVEPDDLPNPYVIWGIIFEEDGITPAPNALVTIKNNETGEIIIDTTDNEGRYQVNLLNLPIKYENQDLINITAELGIYKNWTEYEVWEQVGGNLTNITVPIPVWNPPPQGPGGWGFGARADVIDLITEDIVFEREHLYVNTTFVFKGKIKNVGVTSATNITVRFYVEGNKVGNDQVIGSLEAGESKYASITWLVNETDTHNFTVAADPDNNITEIDDLNNNRTESEVVRSLFSILSRPSWNYLNPVDITFTDSSASAISIGLSPSLSIVSKFDPILNQYVSYVDGFSAPEDDFDVNLKLEKVYYMSFWPGEPWEFGGDDDDDTTQPLGMKYSNNWKLHWWYSEKNGFLVHGYYRKPETTSYKDLFIVQTPWVEWLHTANEHGTGDQLCYLYKDDVIEGPTWKSGTTSGGQNWHIFKVTHKIANGINGGDCTVIERVKIEYGFADNGEFSLYNRVELDPYDGGPGGGVELPIRMRWTIDGLDGDKAYKYGEGWRLSIICIPWTYVCYPIPTSRGLVWNQIENEDQVTTDPPGLDDYKEINGYMMRVKGEDNGKNIYLQPAENNLNDVMEGSKPESKYTPTLLEPNSRLYLLKAGADQNKGHPYEYDNGADIDGAKIIYWDLFYAKVKYPKNSYSANVRGVSSV